MAEEIKFSAFTAADPATLEAAGGIVPSAVAGIGNNKSTWTQIKNWISNPLLALINNMVDKTKPMLQIMIGGLRSVYFSARWFEMDIEDSQPTSVKGAMWYGSDDNLPVVNLDYGVTGSLLDDVITPALNKTGSVIPNGTVCYVSGSQGNRTVVSLAQAVLTPETQIAIVVATHNVAINAVGYFVNRGLVNHLNTSAYTEGQTLWVSTTAGQLTGAAPAKPYSQIAVGVVTRVHATVGQIRVFPFPIPRIGQLTDVNATGIATGQSLRLNSSGVFEPYTPLELGETSSTAYRGDRGKAAYDHSQVMGNPHGTDFSELENKPSTLAGYGITDATVKRGITVSVNAGWYRLGYVDLAAGAQNQVFGNISYAGRESSGYMGFSVTRVPDFNILWRPLFHQTSCGEAPSAQWEIVSGTTIRISFYARFEANHGAFVLYNLGGTIPLTNAYTHEYIGFTKPANTELENCLDRVTLTNEPAQDVLPSGNMTQPTAIQWLRNNVKQLQSSAVVPKNHASTTNEYGEGSLTHYGHVKKAEFMTIDGNDVVPSSLMYQNVVQRFHTAMLGAGTAGWLKVCSLTCVGGYTNEPITITLSRCAADKTCQLTIRFQSTGATNPLIELANYEGQSYGVYYHKRVEGTYDIYVQKVEPYDRCHITEFKSPFNIRLNPENGTVATPPTGAIAFSQAPSDYSKTGRLTSEDWNSFTEVGIYNVAGWSGANGPTINGVQAYKWGFLVVEQSQNTVIQTFYPHQSDMPYYRQSWEGGAFVGWSTSPRTGSGLSPSSSIVYQTHATARSDSNAIYLTY